MEANNSMNNVSRKRMIIQGLDDDDLGDFSANQISVPDDFNEMNQSTIFRAEDLFQQKAPNSRNDPTRHSVIMPLSTQPKEKQTSNKKTYFQSVVQSIKSLNKLIKFKKPKSNQQEQPTYPDNDLSAQKQIFKIHEEDSFSTFQAQLKQLKNLKDQEENREPNQAETSNNVFRIDVESDEEDDQFQLPKPVPSQQTSQLIQQTEQPSNQIVHSQSKSISSNLADNPPEKITFMEELEFDSLMKPGNAIEVEKEESEGEEIEFTVPKRELLDVCCHRIFEDKQLALLNQFPCYFKILMKEVQQQTKPSKSFLSYLWRSKQRQAEKVWVNEIRFIAFEEGHLLVMKYLQTPIIRNYGKFKPEDTLEHKGIPAQHFDAEVLINRDLFDLDTINLTNYSEAKEASLSHNESYVSVMMGFNSFNLSKEEDTERRMLIFNIKYDDLGEFVTELRTQFDQNHVQHASLYIN